jgi:polyisoprenoid-binding protein YceI
MTTSEMQAVPAGTWSVDRVHSTVRFSVDYMAGTFTGTFSDFDVIGNWTGMVSRSG